jgi:hypothetical protein
MTFYLVQNRLHVVHTKLNVTWDKVILYIIEYIVVFCLNDFLVSTTTQQDGSYKKNCFELLVKMA